MKRILIVILLLLVVGCTKNNSQEVEHAVKDNEEEQYIQEETYVDTNPIKLGLFLYDNNYHNKEVLDTYETNFTSGVDIGSFEVFFTDNKVIDGNKFKDTWNKYYNEYNNIDNYKVGFNIKYTLSDGTTEGSNFLEPDIYRYGNYFYAYLYDDINQADGAYYSHLEEMTEENILTSIKLYAVGDISEVESIDLTVFTYLDKNDFKDNIYRGNSKYTITIKNK